ncbi:hypothetical protein [Wolbachia endosymbiont (group A) of Brachyopa scutellaris]|uniref:hypothetical protein n=1 Tax=Wolbachia endosymbiont (group A) of Brachyopa scutellaris TaxID=3066140 RepID=UPI0031330580
MERAITIAFLSILIHHSLCEKHSKLSLHFFWVRSFCDIVKLLYRKVHTDLAVDHAIPRKNLLTLADFCCWKWLHRLNLLMLYTTKLIVAHLRTSFNFTQLDTYTF